MVRIVCAPGLLDGAIELPFAAIIAGYETVGRLCRGDSGI